MRRLVLKYLGLSALECITATWEFWKDFCKHMYIVWCTTTLLGESFSPFLRITVVMCVLYTRSWLDIVCIIPPLFCPLVYLRGSVMSVILYFQLYLVCCNIYIYIALFPYIVLFGMDLVILLAPLLSPVCVSMFAHICCVLVFTVTFVLLVGVHSIPLVPLFSPPLAE